MWLVCKSYTELCVGLCLLENMKWAVKGGQAVMLVYEGCCLLALLVSFTWTFSKMELLSVYPLWKGPTRVGKHLYLSLFSSNTIPSFLFILKGILGFSCFLQRIVRWDSHKWWSTLSSRICPLAWYDWVTCWEVLIDIFRGRKIEQ